MIEVINITKKFGDHIVFNNYSLSFSEGKVTAIMAPSGKGKTTLLNMLMNIIMPDQGEIRGINRKKSAVFQEDRLCMNLSVHANIKMVNPKISKEEIKKAMKDVELEECLDQPVRELSGGMKRRVSILRALLCEYDILFLDEPFQGLDQNTKQMVINYIKDHIKNKTVIMVTHDIEEARVMNADIVTL